MLAAYFPFVLFLIAIIAAALTAAISYFWVAVILALIAMVIGFIFCRYKNSIVSEVILFVIFMFIFSGYFLAAKANDPGKVYKSRHLIDIKVVTLESSCKSFNVLWANIDSMAQKVKVIDYTRRLRYLGRYQIFSSVSKRIYQGRVYYVIYLSKGSIVKEKALNFFESAVWRVSAKVLEVFKDNFSDLTYRFLGSLFLGRYELLQNERQIFIDAGTTHLLAISGLHMVLVSVTLFFLSGLFGLDYRLRLFLASVIIFIYTFLSGLSPSALRAALMFIAVAIGFSLRRHIESLNVLGLAGLVSFLYNPLVILDIGFQLSYLSVISLIIFSKIFIPGRSENIFLQEVNQLFDMSLWVGLCILPVVSFYFGRVYMAAFLYNIVLIPLCNLILLMVFILFILLPFKFLVASLAVFLEPLSVWFIALNKMLGSLPISSIGYRFDLCGIAVYYSIFVVVLMFINRYNKRHELF